MSRVIWGAALAAAMAFAACTDGSQPAEGSADTAAATTTNIAGIPASVSVGSLEWEGTVRVARSEGGVSSLLTAELSGSFVAPGEHRLAVASESSTGDQSESAAWEATIVGGRAWVLEDGDLRGYDAEGVADEYMTVLGTATGCVVPSPALLTELGSIRPVRVDELDGRRVAVFQIGGAALSRYAPLFASDFGLVFGASVQTADVTLSVDAASGLVLEARLAASEPADGLEVEVAFEVTRVDDPSIVIAVDDEGAPGGGALTGYRDPDSRFSVSYPGSWDVDPFADGAVFGPPFTESRAYASVVVVGPAATVGDVVDRILADAVAGTEILERTQVDSGGLGFERLVLEFREGERVLRGILWATVADGTGYAFQVVAEERRFDGYEELGESMLATFRPGGG